MLDLRGDGSFYLGLIGALDGRHEYRGSWLATSSEDAVDLGAESCCWESDPSRCDGMTGYALRIGLLGDAFQLTLAPRP